jgi:uncharacterized repeat protein (TIGR01451 family)
VTQITNLCVVGANTVCRVDTPTPGTVTTTKALTTESGTLTGVGVAEPGETLGYTVTLTSTGGPVVNYEFVDQYDPNTTLVANSAKAVLASSGASVGAVTVDTAARKVTWKGNIPAGDKVLLTLSVKVVAVIPAGVTQITNLCVVGANTVCRVDTPTPGTVTTTKALTTESGTLTGVAEPSERLTYTITLTNSGGTDVTGYALTDEFDVNTVFVSATNGGNASGTSITWTNLTVPAGRVLAIKVVVDVVDPIPVGVTHVANLTYETGSEPPVCTPSENGDPRCVVTPTAVPTSDVSVAKRVGLTQVHRGDKVPYTILVTNNSATLPVTVTVTDRIPSGFRYVAGSGRIDNVAAEPRIAGRLLSFSDVTIAAKQTVEVHLDLLVLSTVSAGRHKNFANALDSGGNPVGPDASAEVTVVVDPVFDCGDIIGKVFDDTNRNGYQDEHEAGLPGVRLATTEGLLVTTDEHGRYHVPCAALPDSRIGSNFILKLDTRTLPTGYRLTTENPRVIRLTAGKMTKLNFGAAVGRVVRLGVNDQAFEAQSTELTPQWRGKLRQLIQVLDQEPSTLRLSYVDAGANTDLADRRLQNIRNKIDQMWAAKRDRYQLEIETRVETSDD